MTAAAFSVAMILAAGRGKRMRPLSSVVPKPALDLPDGPVIASAMRLVEAAGVERVVVNTWHLAERMAQAVAEVELDHVEVVLSAEERLMGTAGGLALATEKSDPEVHRSALLVHGTGRRAMDELRGVLGVLRAGEPSSGLPEPFTPATGTRADVTALVALTGRSSSMRYNPVKLSDEAMTKILSGAL